jgi:3-oxoacyl-[acyl-carrier-protein] synthase II
MIEARDGRRVVITGVGVVSSCGLGRQEFWAGLAKQPEPASLRPVRDFDPVHYGLSRGAAHRLDRFAHFGLAAAGEALADADLLEAVESTDLDAAYPADRLGVQLGSAIGGANAWEGQAYVLRDKGADHVSALTVPRVMPNSAAAAVSIRWGAQGACETISTACAAGTHAIGAAARMIASGRLDAAIAGGAEACLTGVNAASFANMRAMSPTGMARPFDPARDGFCCAEGAAMLILEEAGHARSRGARVYAEVLGTGSTADAFHLTAPASDGEGARRCMELALADAGTPASEVTQVNAHGTGTQLNDATEARALTDLFGADGPPVTSVKGALGHALGAGGALEAAAVALSYANREIPPTVGSTGVDPTLALDVVLEPRPWEPGLAISNSFAFGGHNACLVFGPAG